MTRNRKILLWGSAGALASGVLAIWIIGTNARKHIEPYIRDQAIRYLEERFESNVRIGALHVSLPPIRSWRMFWSKGNGAIAEVTVNDIVLHSRATPDLPPTFSAASAHFAVDIGTLYGPRRTIQLVELKGVGLHIPPKERRAATQRRSAPSNVVIERLTLDDSTLVIHPRDPSRRPLQFDLHHVDLRAVGPDQPMSYQAVLTNAVPPGRIQANGRFGPFDASSPGDTFLDGSYTYTDADLGVFSTIAGTLNSTGSFTGTLGAVEAKGEATVPNFQLRAAGHPMLLQTTFEALIDGTNGNTVLKPVHARLATTSFQTSGAILKHERGQGRAIDLKVTMPDGEIMELLQLATKTKPVMAGRLRMDAVIRIPPLRGKVKEKLILDGKFRISRGQFLVDTIQDKIDSLSRRGQGQPKNEEIDNVFSSMEGVFHMSGQQITFKSLQFGVPGAQVDLAGVFDTAEDNLDFHGTLRLDARVSQTMTGWKRWALKVADPLFAKNGAGTYLKIKVAGESAHPQFGRDR